MEMGCKRGVPRGTTPTFEFILRGVDLTEAERVYVTFRYLGVDLTKSGDDLSVSVEEVEGNPETTVTVSLTQDETLGFPEGEIKVQVNWTYADGSRAGSEVGGVVFGKQLLEVVLE